MKPFGREKNISSGRAWKIDNHPPKGYVNWWKNMCDFLTRSRMKQINKKEIDKEIEEYYKSQ